jgi:hypothetical protein
LRKISSPASAAKGWLVVTMPLRAITSERPWAIQPSARSPRTALQKAGFDASLALQLEDARSAAEPSDASARADIAAKTTRARESVDRIFLFMNVSLFPSLALVLLMIGDD